MRSPYNLDSGYRRFYIMGTEIWDDKPSGSVIHDCIAMAYTPDSAKEIADALELVYRMRCLKDYTDRLEDTPVQLHTYIPRTEKRQ